MVQAGVRAADRWALHAPGPDPWGLGL